MANISKSSRILAFIAFIILSVVSIGAYFLLKDVQGPRISYKTELHEENLNANLENNTLLDRIGPHQEIIVTASDYAGVKKLIITVQRGAQRMTLFEKEFSPPMPTVEFPFILENAKLPEGAFLLEVKAYDNSLAGFGSGNATTETFKLSLDNKAPRIAVKTQPPGIRRGGSALVIYEVNEPVKETGIYVEDVFFKAYEQKENIYACLFPFPEHLQVNAFLPQIMAKDLAGNITESRLLVNARNTNFKEDTLKITDSFLEAKKEELAKLSPTKPTLLEQYIDANNQSRVRDNAILLAIGQSSAPTINWDGAFIGLPRSAVKATFGDRRSYVYNGEVIDKQIHMGIDFASVAKDKIPAANNGKVVYADPLGIYGNLVIIDHGLGLFSIYSHLTDMYVKVDEEVKKGHHIGTTGTTGLAGGDHVHFGFMVGGIAVEPREWLDSTWIRNNITSRLALIK